jgi:hypothetical protein
MVEHFCQAMDVVHFDATLHSPWLSVPVGLVQPAVELSFVSDWFVQVQNAGNYRTCCSGREGDESSAIPAVAYEEQGTVLLELELVSGGIFTQTLRTWNPIPFADKDKLQPPRNEAVVLNWPNLQGLNIRRVRAAWLVQKGFNQG